MKTILKSFILSSLIFTSATGFSSEASRAKLVLKHPGLDDAEREENPKILCPFHRMLERAGIYDMSTDGPGPLLIRVLKITTAAKEFGCDVIQCGTVATAVSGGQTKSGTSRFGSVNIEALHTALGIAHECGLTFVQGGTEVNDAHRARTLAALASLQDAEGRLQLEDLNSVKESICAEQGVKNDFAGKTEMKLIYSFLGGRKRGFIDYTDVERFLHGQLPLTVEAPNGI
ncbi:MAG: hypothetical protein H7318_04445 [Oligoflexus sp.]|nr:hypothetical protein [Oligoflexus sp.]